MAEIKMLLYLILVLQFAVVTEQHTPSLMVRAGDDVTLPCKNVINDQHECDRTTWLFNRFPSASAVDLIAAGRISESSKSKSDRLNVTENCSLLLRKVTAQDAALYFCQQSGRQEDSKVFLSVINMTEHKDDDQVTFKCSVSTRGQCRHTVKWLYVGKDVDRHNQDIKTSQSYCSANVTFKTSHFISTSKNLFKCEVEDANSREVHVFPFRPLTSGEKPVRANNREFGNNDATVKTEDPWWLYVVVAVGLAALVITVVALIRWKRNKGNKSQTDKNMGLSLNPAAGTSQDTAEPEDGVSYASISHKTTGSKVRGGDDAVTYSSVKTPSSFADPSSLYASISNQ